MVMGRDHPRACGAYHHHILIHEYDTGSPPRMRGLPVMECNDFIAVGITPAHAGLTLNGMFSVIEGGDHPRACGAYQLWQGAG